MTQDDVRLVTNEPLFTDDVLARLRRVILRSRRLANSGLSGEHRSLRKGPSPEFADFKAYSVGDDFRRIDWRAYARFDSLFVRESEIITEFDVHILIDVSRSMEWSGAPGRSSKLRTALQVSGALGYLSLWHFDRVSITPVGSDAPRRFGPVQGRTNIRPMLSWLERLHAQREGDLVNAMNRLVHERRRAGILLVVSDFLSDDLDRLEQAMRGAVGRGWEIALIQVYDPAEEDPAELDVLGETNRATDLESNAHMPIRSDPASLAGYQARRKVWLDELGRLGGGVRTVHVPVSTAQLIDRTLVTFLRKFGLVL